MLRTCQVFVLGFNAYLSAHCNVLTDGAEESACMMQMIILTSSAATADSTMVNAFRSA